MDASGSGCLLFMGLHRAVFTWYRGRVEYFPTPLITEKALARDQVCPVDVTTDVHNLARGKIAMQPRRREHQKFCARSHAAHLINSTAPQMNSRLLRYEFQRTLICLIYQRNIDFTANGYISLGFSFN